jgi:hypothetical protein
MKTRRDFFRQLAGQVGVLKDEVHGVECIPLSRLNELPDRIIKKIEPVFFPDEKWEIKNNILYHQINENTIKTELSNVEIQSINFFRKNFSLEVTATVIKNNAELPFKDIYEQVASLFFKLAVMHICHPRKIYRIDEIIKSEKSRKDGQF